MLYVGIRNEVGYETRLAVSDDLLSWTPLGTVLPFRDAGWDRWQADGSLALVDPAWGGSAALQPYDGRYWISYFGGAKQGYETDPLSLGLAWTRDAHPGRRRGPASRRTRCSRPSQPDARPFERATLYKSHVLWDKAESLGYPFVMYYNAKQQGPWIERIGMAVSRDMVHWSRYGRRPVIDNGSGISGDPQIVRMGDLWVMFYFGAGWKPGAFDTFAVSYDLVHWTKWTGADLDRAIRALGQDVRPQAVGAEARRRRLPLLLRRGQGRARDRPGDVAGPPPPAAGGHEVGERVSAPVSYDTPGLASIASAEVGATVDASVTSRGAFASLEDPMDCRPLFRSFAALVLGVMAAAPSLAQDPVKLTVRWDKVTRVSKTTPTLQVVVNPPLRRGTAVHDGAFKSLADLQADYVRYVPWLPYPRLGVAELEPPKDGKTSWDFALIDPMTIDFLEATKGHPVVLNFSTIPQWMVKTEKPVSYPADPDQPVWDYTQGSDFRDPTFKEVADYYARLLSWYTQGGFTDELGKRHESGHHYTISHWEVLNEPDLERNLTPEAYTRLYDAVVEAMRRVQPATKFGGISLAFPGQQPALLRALPEPEEPQAGHPPRLHHVPLLRGAHGRPDIGRAAVHVLRAGRRLPELGPLHRGDPPAAVTGHADDDQRDRLDLRGRPRSGSAGLRLQADPGVVLVPVGRGVRVSLR